MSPRERLDVMVAALAVLPTLDLETRAKIGECPSV